MLLDEFNFELIEEFDCISDPHGMENTDIHEEQQRQAADLYKNKSHIVSVRFANHADLKNVYFYTVESLQYIYIRNYTKKQVSFITKTYLIKIRLQNSLE